MATVLRMLDLKAALADVTSELARASREHTALQRKIEALEAEKRGLELALARHNGHGEALANANGEAKEWQSLSRTDAVLRVLHLHPEALGPAEITTRLLKHGRNDRREPVAAALAYLKREGRVLHNGPSQWTVEHDHEFLDFYEGGDA